MHMFMGLLARMVNAMVTSSSSVEGSGMLHLKIQNEQLLERLQYTCSSSYVSDCHMVDCLEDSHDMRDHEKHGKL